MRTLRIPLDPDPGQGDPVLDCYLLERMPGEQPRHFTSVIICPGGGYTHLSPREGEPVAMAFAAQGMQTFVLRYSLKPGRDRRFLRRRTSFGRARDVLE